MREENDLVLCLTWILLSAQIDASQIKTGAKKYHLNTVLYSLKLQSLSLE